MTKTFTATIVLQLVAEGKLGLSNTLDDHLPGVVPRGDEITIRQLLQHRSGLVNYTDYTSWLKEASRSPSTRPIDLLRFAGSKPLAFEPGSRWSYSNTNYIALGLVIERVTGSSYVRELEQRILRPIGLDATELPETRRLPDLGDDTELSPVPGLPKGDPVYDVDWANPTVSWAAGAIVSSARDIARFYSALLSGRILSSAFLARMKETVSVGPPGTRAGLGIFSGSSRCGRSWGHGGGILDYATLVSASEEGERVGVISVYGRPSGQPPDQSALVCAEYRLAESATTSKIAFIRTPRSGSGSKDTNELSVVNADGSALRKLTGNTLLATPTWSPNGGKIAFESGRGGNAEVYVMNADGSAQRNLTRNAARDGAPAWSPDGRKIAFVRERGGNAEVYVMNADGSAQRNLTRSAARDDAPAWSPDGRKIAFTRKVAWVGGVGGQFEIFVMNADGSGQRRLTRDASGNFAPAWSPDGRKIAFETRIVWGGPSGEWFDYDVYVVNADGSGQLRPLSLVGELRRPREARAPHPLWSPDGRMIAFLSSHDGNFDVYVMNADGSGQTNVTRSRANEGWLAWSPRQRR